MALSEIISRIYVPRYLGILWDQWVQLFWLFLESWLVIRGDWAFASPQTVEHLINWNQTSCILLIHFGGFVF